MKVSFIEEAQCKRATKQDPSRLARETSGAVWYCVVSAGPDWEAYGKREPEAEGGTSFQVGFGLDADGAILPASVFCVAPG